MLIMRRRGYYAPPDLFSMLTVRKRATFVLTSIRHHSNSTTPYVIHSFIHSAYYYYYNSSSNNNHLVLHKKEQQQQQQKKGQQQQQQQRDAKSVSFPNGFRGHKLPPQQATFLFESSSWMARCDGGTPCANHQQHQSTHNKKKKKKTRNIHCG